MLNHVIAVAVIATLSTASPALAQTPPAAPTSPAAAPTAAAASTGFSVENSELGALLDNPGAKAVLAKHIPELIANEQIDMGRSMTLKQLQQYAGDALSDDVLAKIQVDLDKLPKK